MALSVSSSPVTVTCKAVLFDMDGILISSIGSVERSWTKWCNMRGVDPAYAISVIHGRRAIDSLRVVRPDLDAEKELEILEDLECEDVDDIIVLAGVCDLLKALPHERWTIVTSATERLAKVRLKEARLPAPDHFVHGDKVAQGKPHPAPFLAGAEMLGVAPEDCVVFEDSASGVAAGKAAGCTVIATLFTHPAEELADADYIVRDLTGIAVRSTADGFTITFTERR
ncbi:HAD-IA family hydrolase [Occallatibacter riparius]|uniref:HAD-IA family hydrolase n=1 Tax=Occallatibacter riparius TaxID=1002689 RepID=A0A9J7BLU0_9BACT|nr:HAD-IA family hydrolase [Occallatibacter riparius]UWZ82181.1 HAD-IA family hydrolase [Occallatibacter riparius]